MMSDDFTDEDLQRFLAGQPPKEAAARPPLRLVTPLVGDGSKYGLAALEAECSELAAMAPNSGRNDKLNSAAFNIYSLVLGGELREKYAMDQLWNAAMACGLGVTESEKTIASGCRAAETKVGARSAPPREPLPAAQGPLIPTRPEGPRQQIAPAARSLAWRRGSQVSKKKPIWAWEYGEHGRIQVGTLCLLAGRPGAGKSTAARWFAARATQGELDGCWYGERLKVAYVATEEALEYTTLPGLAASDADLDMIHFPKAHVGGVEQPFITADTIALTEYCLEQGIKIVVVDPLMSTIPGQADINKNNEARAHVNLWAKLAERIDGTVLAVVHLRKNSPAGDVVAAVTGSSAFGEVARSIFGFAKNPDTDERVMSQHKNSTGREDLSLTYQIKSRAVTMTNGEIADDVGAFEIIGKSDVTVEDIMTDHMQNIGGTSLSECKVWLEDYLQLEGPSVPSKDVRSAAKKEGGWSESTVKRAAAKLRVVTSSVGYPRQTAWSLPLDPTTFVPN